MINRSVKQGFKTVSPLLYFEINGLVEVQQNGAKFKILCEKTFYRRDVQLKVVLITINKSSKFRCRSFQVRELSIITWPRWSKICHI